MRRLLVILAVTIGAVVFFWLFPLKLIARLANRLGRSTPCPASLSWIVDNPLRRWYMRPLLDRVGIQAGERVLELGPGPGTFTIEAARRAEPGNLIAVDIQPQMITALDQKVREQGLDNVVAHVADACQLPLDDGSVDRAFLVTVLPEIPDRQGALAELRRVLRAPDPTEGRPGGVLSVTEEFPDPDYPLACETIHWAERAGFELEERHGNWWVYTLNFRRSGDGPVQTAMTGRGGGL
jgi:SAM-dependent methyltransferase